SLLVMVSRDGCMRRGGFFEKWGTGVGIWFRGMR
ncbi:hypothetical protein A2U01_0080994, partial [Trifolium medium]|nr:hypothetical protein [Trifolium medium]